MKQFDYDAAARSDPLKMIIARLPYYKWIHASACTFTKIEFLLSSERKNNLKFSFSLSLSLFQVSVIKHAIMS